MTTTRESRRRRIRERKNFPAGMFVGLLTSALVTLLGAFVGLDPMVILTRAFVSAVTLGCLVSLGISVVRLANAEFRDQQPVADRLISTRNAERRSS